MTRSEFRHWKGVYVLLEESRKETGIAGSVTGYKSEATRTVFLKMLRIKKEKTR